MNPFLKSFDNYCTADKQDRRINFQELFNNKGYYTLLVIVGQNRRVGAKYEGKGEINNSHSIIISFIHNYLKYIKAGTTRLRLSKVLRKTTLSS